MLGAAKGFETTSAPLISIMMGVITAVAGGMLRDVVCNEVPLIFHGEIYATCAFLGGAVYVSMQYMQIDVSYSLWAGVTSALLLRIAAMSWGWSLPKSRMMPFSSEE